MTAPREPFSWDQDGDLPIPLGIPTSDDVEIPVSHQILSEAETVVRDAQGAIGRQDTDPTITIPDTDSGKSAKGSPQVVARPRVSLSRRSLVITLTVACAFAFLHGWSVGARAKQPPPRTCDAHHCPVDPS